jgi:hypothetical protein
MTEAFENTPWKRLLPPETTAGWERAARWLARPEDLLPCGEPERRQAWSDLALAGAVPSFLARAQEAGILPRLGEEAKRRRAAGIAQAEVVRLELEHALGVLARQELTPVPVKGAHLAFAAYPAPHLRPMTDLDLAFRTPKEAERAQSVLLAAGYREAGEPSRGGDPWLWSRHLPELESPLSKIRLEMHGGIVYTPRDRRSVRDRRLLAEARPAGLLGRKVFLLGPEAALVAAAAHAFVRHGDVAPSLLPVFDAKALVESAGDGFEWPKLAALAKETAAASAVAVAVSAARDLLGAKVPERWPETLAPSGSSQETILRPTTAINWTNLWNAGGPARLLQRFAFTLVPVPRFLRWKYRDLGPRPLPGLYGLLWREQARKVLHLEGGRKE